MVCWAWLGGILDFCAVYFTTQLIRCAVFSLVLIGLVMLLRKKLFSEKLFSERTFLRGILWAAFLIIPFLGRLKLFYENAVFSRITGWMIGNGRNYRWFGRIYSAGILVVVVCILGKRLHLQRAVARMKKASVDNISVRVTEMQVTPFTVGLLKPEIVLPQIMVESYSRDELNTVVQHERTHIRLGHLWCGFAWDILRCLLWVNPFLTICRKHFQADMEDICDRVCIQGCMQSSGKTAQEYGLILLKSLKLLRCGQNGMPSAVAYAGETCFADIKRRMKAIAAFRPYRKRLCTGMAVATFMMIGVVLTVIYTHSYARCNESSDIMVYQYTGEGTIISTDTRTLSRMISYDDSYVYVDREAFENFLCQKNAEGEIYIVFGGYYKLPGMGGAAESCCYERTSTDRIVRIPYESISGRWEHVLFKLL